MTNLEQDQPYTRPATGLPTGHDEGLSPLSPVDISRVRTLDDFAKEIKKTSFDGGEVGNAVDVLTEMVMDKDTFVVMTVSGAMTPAKMSYVMCDMIDKGMVQAVVSTGALMAHGFVEAAGMAHFRVPKGLSDEELYKKGYNRIYTALEPESNLDEVEKKLNEILSTLDANKILSSRLITEKIGEHLDKHVPGRGILKSAFRKGVPVFVPAFTDSELGLDVGLINQSRREQGLPRFRFDPFLDLDFYSELIKHQVGKKLAIFTIGGGVPRNWAQQIGPYIDLQQKRSVTQTEIDPVMFHYAVRITPEPVGLGGLSGCTYEEGKSWGKFWPNGKFAEVPFDATLAWPLITGATIQRIGRKKIMKDVFTGKKALRAITKIVEDKYYGN